MTSYKCCSLDLSYTKPRRWLTLLRSNNVRSFTDTWKYFKCNDEWAESDLTSFKLTHQTHMGMIWEALISFLLSLSMSFHLILHGIHYTRNSETRKNCLFHPKNFADVNPSSKESFLCLSHICLWSMWNYSGFLNAPLLQTENLQYIYYVQTAKILGEGWAITVQKFAHWPSNLNYRIQYIGWCQQAGNDDEKELL